MNNDTRTYAIYPSLAGRSVFITGGASGIGEGLVEHFSAQGCKVAFVDIAEEAGRALVEHGASQDLAGIGQVLGDGWRISSSTPLRQFVDLLVDRLATRRK